MRGTTITAMAAALMMGVFGFGGSAGAVPATGSTPAITSAAPLVDAATVVVKKKKHKKTVWVYNPGKHGKRWRYKRGPYLYYYGGYYYTRPWWTPGLNICIGC